jgi:hypothetical protein
MKKSKMLLNFDNNAYTFPEIPEKFVLNKRISGEYMTRLRDKIKTKILSLTNIDKSKYDDYGIYFTISGSAAIDCIIRTIMGVY